MVSVLDKLVDNQGDSYKSNSWYRDNVKKIYSKASARKLMNQGKLLGRPSVGRLNLFFYDPKFKETLPYYDRFPLVLPLEPIKGGFMGLNFHYLPPVLRLKLLEEMSAWAVRQDLSKSNRFDVSYDRVSSIPLIKPTIKKYLWGHVRSSFLRIDTSEAAIACYLPVQQFKKRSAAYVYGQSRGMI
jgi:hypothetical protein